MDYKKYNEAERAYWAQTKAQGKRRFILHEIFFNVILWVGIAIVLPFTDRPLPSLQRSAVTALIMLPIFLLGGYLTGKWKWSDFEKRFSD